MLVYLFGNKLSFKLQVLIVLMSTVCITYSKIKIDLHTIAINYNYLLSKQLNNPTQNISFDLPTSEVIRVYNSRPSSKECLVSMKLANKGYGYTIEVGLPLFNCLLKLLCSICIVCSYVIIYLFSKAIILKQLNLKLNLAEPFIDTLSEKHQEYKNNIKQLKSINCNLTKKYELIQTSYKKLFSITNTIEDYLLDIIQMIESHALLLIASDGNDRFIDKDKKLKLLQEIAIASKMLLKPTTYRYIFESIDIRQLLLDIIDANLPVIYDNNINITYNIPITTIYADRVVITQIIASLLTKLLQTLPTKSNIHIEAFTDANCLHLDISDDGFNRYFQEPSSCLSQTICSDWDDIIDLITIHGGKLNTEYTPYQGNIHSLIIYKIASLCPKHLFSSVHKLANKKDSTYNS